MKYARFCTRTCLVRSSKKCKYFKYFIIINAHKRARQPKKEVCIFFFGARPLNIYLPPQKRLIISYFLVLVYK